MTDSGRERMRSLALQLDTMTSRLSATAERLFTAIGTEIVWAAGLSLGITGCLVAVQAASRLPAAPWVVPGLLLTGGLGSALTGFLMAAHRRPDLVRTILGTLATGSFAFSLAYLTTGPSGDEAFGAFLGYSLIFTFFLFLAILFEGPKR